MKRVLRIAMIVLALAVAAGAAYAGTWWLVVTSLASAALETFWLVRAWTPLRIKRAPLRIGSGGGRG